MPPRGRSPQKVGRTGARFPRLAPQDAPGDPRTTGDSGVDAGRKALAPEDDAAALPTRSERAALGLTGARFPRRDESCDPDSGQPAPSTATGPDAAPSDVPTSAAADAPPDSVDEATAAHGVPVVRPYVLTHGRTRSAVDLPLEALVTLGATAQRAAGGMDLTLIGLCREPRSVAEIAALTGAPLGVARVLIGDLVTTGALVVCGTADPQGPSLALLHRVLAGLRSL